MNTQSLVKKIFPKSFKLFKKELNRLSKDKIQSYHVPRTLHFLRCIKLVENLDGAILEAGVREGHSLTLLGLLSKETGKERKIIASDSFQGFPKDSLVGDKPMPGNPTMTVDEAIENVKRSFKLSGYSDSEINNIIFLPGYFENTLKNYDQGPIALMHIDVDLGKSYTTVLEHLYGHLQTGGIITFDEYDAPKDLEKWPDAKPAIDTFFKDKHFEIITPGYIQKFAIRKLD